MCSAIKFNTARVSPVARKYLTDNVDTNSWKDNGGDVGEITGDVAKGQLTVIQTHEAQRKLKAILQALRASLKPEPKNAR